MAEVIYSRRDASRPWHNERDSRERSTHLFRHIGWVMHSQDDGPLSREAEMGQCPRSAHFEGGTIFPPAHSSGSPQLLLGLGSGAFLRVNNENHFLPWSAGSEYCSLPGLGMG